MWLFLLVLWMLWEASRYQGHRRRVRQWKQQRRLIAPLRDSWNQERRGTVPQLALHCELARGLAGYESGERDVLQPHYKPLLYYGFLRGTHDLAFQVAKWYGWHCRVEQGVWFWERGTGPTVLFLHGFGFGPYVYGRALHGLSQSRRIVAPQYPGLSYDGREEVPRITDYAQVVANYFGDQKYSILSNSFGTVVHHAILRELGAKAPQRIIQQIYVEPVCFYPYAGQLFNFVELSWGSCWKAASWRAMSVAILSYLLVAKDPSTLYLCQQILEDPHWDGEVHLPNLPTTVVLSGRDSLVRVPELAEYFAVCHPYTRVLLLPEAYHGEAFFSSRLDLDFLLGSQAAK
jgi:pimeloyl-ACP methyl ester carboxylesterase